MTTSRYHQLPGFFPKLISESPCMLSLQHIPRSHIKPTPQFMSNFVLGESEKLG
jgi:hypothetical protein